MAASKLQLKSRIVEVLEDWARWRAGGARSRNNNTTVLARMMSGLPSTRCPECKGEGMVPRERPDGSRRYVICPECEGSCRIRLKPTKSNPERACPACQTSDGAGRKISTGEIDGRTCHKCHGSARVRGESIHHKVNPALIPSTKHGSNPTEDALFIRVESAICALPELHQLVIFQEYCRIGRQEDKCDRIGIGRHKYLATLAEAHARLTNVLNL